MGTFFNDTHIQQILQATGIKEVVESYVALKPVGKELVGLCPFHDDSRPSLYVNPAKQIFKCFACGAGGDVIKFMMLREKMSFPEAVKLLAERAGIQLPERGLDGPKEEFSRDELEKVNRWAARYFRRCLEDEHLGKNARAYLSQRQVQPEIARRFGLGYAPAGWDNLVRAAQQEGMPPALLVALGLIITKDDASCYDRFRDRLMFPVIDAMGRVIAFGGRTLADDPAKYLNSPESPLFDKSRALYGIHTAKDSIIKSHTVVVVEGYTDCLMAHQFGITHVVATLGTALTDEHARILSRYAERIVLLFDSDAAGQKAADRALEILFGRGMDVRLAAVPEGKDPCDFLLLKGPEAFSQLVREASESLEYKWKLTRERLEKEDTVGGFQRAAEDFLTVVAKAFALGQVDAIARGFLVNHVAKLVGQPVETINDRLRRREKQHRPVRESVVVNHAEDACADPDSLTKAYQEVLEVLFNRPDWLAQAVDIIAGPDEFSSPLLREMARRLWSRVSQDRPADLAGIVACCEDPALCGQIIRFAERAEERGHLAETLAGALERIQRAKADKRRSDIRQELAWAAQKYGPEVEEAMLMEFHAQRKKPDPRCAGGR